MRNNYSGLTSEEHFSMMVGNTIMTQFRTPYGTPLARYGLNEIFFEGIPFKSANGATVIIDEDKNVTEAQIGRHSCNKGFWIDYYQATENGWKLIESRAA